MSLILTGSILLDSTFKANKSLKCSKWICLEKNAKFILYTVNLAIHSMCSIFMLFSNVFFFLRKRLKGKMSEITGLPASRHPDNPNCSSQDGGKFLECNACGLRASNNFNQLSVKAGVILFHTLAAQCTCTSNE